MPRFASKLFLGLIVFLIPCVSSAQFSALRWVDAPEVGDWAQYVRTQTVGEDMTYMVVKIAVVGSTVRDGQEYLWFELSSHMDALFEIAEDRVPYTARFYLKKGDLKSCESELIEKLGDFVIKLGKRDPVRIPSNLKEQVVSKGFVSGGTGGGGSCIEYTFNDEGRESITVDAGTFDCIHKKGMGKAKVVTNVESRRTADVSSELDLWLRDDVPFGIVKSVNYITGKGPQTDTVSLKVDTTETYSLKAHGRGAKTSLTKEPVPYSLDTVSDKVD